MIRTRFALAPVLFAAAVTGCTTPASPPASNPDPVARAVALTGPRDTLAPRFLRGGAMPAQPAATAAAAALAHVRALAPQWGATAGLADLTAVATLPVAGGDIVRIRQSFDGIPVERGELRLLVAPGGALVAASGVAVAATLPRDRAGFTAGRVQDGRDAVARAVTAVHGVTATAAAFAAKPGASDPADPATWVRGTVGDIDVSEARARRAWYRTGDALAAAWIVEAYTGAIDSTDARLHRVIIGARGGRVLEQRDLTVDAAHAYRVWADPAGDLRPADGPVADFSPHPTGAPGGGRPAFVPPPLVTVDGLNDNGSGGSDPWLPAGATETRGNNVDAYTDANTPSGFGGADFRAATTAAGVFDRVYDTTLGPMASPAQQMASITQLFYALNWLHDDWYDAGFTEAAGVGQADNFGRGGVAGDPVLAEAQDSANAANPPRNNANMSTPDDGMNPRMQVYLWSGTSQQSITLTPGTSPASVSSASYGPGSYTITADLVAASDGAGTSSTDGCEAFASNVAGRVALVDRGNCTFKTKTLNAQNAGAAGLIIVNNVATGLPSLSNDSSITTAITIPTQGMTMADGGALRVALQGGAVSARLFRQQGVEADGGLDGALVAHEFGHYIHHRLSVCGTAQCGAMSEGWGDFIAMHMIARAGDDLHGAYSVSGYAFAGDPYFGIRRAPYSVDTAKNAFTFQLVAEGEPLPTSHPTNGGGSNSEVHNAGEVWASAMWEVYVALQDVPGADFAATRAKMARYVVAGLQLAPPDGTFTEVRDAILAAAFAASPADHDVMAAAFARRGLGTCAVSPDRGSDDFVGTVENFEVSARALPGAATLTLVNDCDADGALDIGDTATLSVPVANAGAVALTGGAQVTATTATPGLSLPTAPVAIASIAPYGTAMATFDVTVTADIGAGPVAGLVDLTVTAAGCTPTSTVRVPMRLQTDVTPAASATDAFDAVPSVWTTEGDDAALVWSHAIEAGLDRRWAGADAGTMVDTALVSPAMTASATTPVVVTFDHAFSFEYSNETYWDGGVIEVSTDDGATWTDVATLTTPGYNGVLGGDSGNPLDGRNAYGGTNPSYPAPDRVTLDFGTQLAGTTFKLRFRIATDGGVGAPGWTIDDVSVAGITGTPFPVQGAEAGGCGTPVGPDAGVDETPGEPGGCCSTGGGARPGDLVAGLLVGAALVLRRRRRRA